MKKNKGSQEEAVETAMDQISKGSKDDSLKIA